MERQSRSQAYQWKIVEQLWDFSPGTLEGSKHEFGTEEALHPTAASEQVLKLNEEVIEYIIASIPSQLTKKQSQVFLLLLEGKTQQEMSMILNGNKNNSSIVKCISGNGVKGEANGGMRDKIKKILLRDERYRQLILSLPDTCSTTHNLTRSWFQNETDFIDWTESPINPITRVQIWKEDYLRDQFKSFDKKRTVNQLRAKEFPRLAIETDLTQTEVLTQFRTYLSITNQESIHAPRRYKKTNARGAGQPTVGSAQLHAVGVRGGNGSV